jgi:hypothetical protein
MFKGKFVVLSLIAAALLSWQVAGVDNANSGIVEPCSSTASAAPGCFLICPQGDGARLDAIGSVVSIQAKDATGAPIAGIPGSDFWLLGCGGNLNPCGGSGSINADSASNSDGRTTIAGDLSAGGCELSGLSVVIQGIVLVSQTNCLDVLCLPLVTVSPDIDGDGSVGLLDFSQFATGYPSPPKTLTPCLDYDCSGTVNLIDFSLFAGHYLHGC